jgi:hypothetical protein
MKKIIAFLILISLDGCLQDKPKQKPMEDFSKIITSASTEFMATKGVTGVGQGKTDDGKDCIIIFVNDSNVITKDIPKKYKKVPVLIQVIGQVDAQ